MKFVSIVLMLIMLTDPPNEDTDYAGKKGYTLDSRQPDGEKLWKQKFCSFLALGFFLFVSCILDLLLL